MERTPPPKKNPSTVKKLITELGTPIGATKQTSLSGFLIQSSSKRNRQSPGCDNDGDPLSMILSAMDRNQCETNKRFDSLNATVESKLNAVDAKVDSLECSVSKATSDIGALQRRLDEADQDKLSTHMVINGVEASLVDRNKTDMLNFAIQLFGSFQITVAPADIEKAYAFSVDNNKRRVIVIFQSSAVKQKIMSAKRASKDERKIYFDHRVTAKFGEILRQLRAFAKVDGGRAFLYGGRVHYQKEPNTRIRVDSIDEIAKLSSPDQ